MSNKVDANTRSTNNTAIIVAIITLIGGLISAGYFNDFFGDSQSEPIKNSRPERPGAVSKR